MRLKSGPPLLQNVLFFLPYSIAFSLSVFEICLAMYLYPLCSATCLISQRPMIGIYGKKVKHEMLGHCSYALIIRHLVDIS